MSTGNQDLMVFMAKKKSVVVAYILWFFFGMLGVHRFYLNSKIMAFVELALTVLGVITLFLLGIGAILLSVCGILWLIDLFLIPSLTRNYNLSLAKDLGNTNTSSAVQAVS